MAYLTQQDYKTYIQGDYLRQLAQGDQDKRAIEENVSIQVIVQRLSSKYDLDMELTPTLPYDKTKTYTAGQRVTLDINANGFKQWLASEGYSVGDMVIYSGIGYKCTTANSDAVFTPANWALVGNQYAIYYVAYPPDCTLAGQPNKTTLTNPYAPVFSYKNLYLAGDIVFYRGDTWECAQDSTIFSHQAKLQYTEIGNIPYSYVFPNDPIGNKQGQYWKNRTAYATPAGTPLTDETWWVRGDNRNQTIKDAVIRITVFKLSPLIAPKNVPTAWLDDYRSILRELKDASMGDISINLPYKQPTRNLRTAYGGYVKNVNGY